MDIHPIPVFSDNTCYIPSLKKGNAILGVCAYKKEDDELSLVFSPKPTMFWVGDGSFTDEYTNEEVPEISRFEEYCRMLLEKLGEKIDSSNNIKGIASGEFLSIYDLSSVESNVKISIEGSIPENVENIKLFACGKNFLDEKALQKGFLTAEGKISASFNYYRCFEGFLPAGEYTLSIDGGNTKLSFSNIMINGEYTAINSVSVDKYTITIPASGYVRFCFRKGDMKDFSETETIQLERGEEVSEFEECTCRSFNFGISGVVESELTTDSYLNIFCDSAGVSLKAEYNRDINRALERINNAILSLGGNI